MNAATIAFRRMILHLAIAEVRPKPMGASVLFKNRQEQTLRSARERVTFKCAMNLPSQSAISCGGSNQHQSDPPFEFDAMIAEDVEQGDQCIIRIEDSNRKRLTPENRSKL